MLLLLEPKVSFVMQREDFRCQLPNSNLIRLFLFYLLKIRRKKCWILKRAYEQQSKKEIKSAGSNSYAGEAKISSWAKEAIKDLAEQGIMIGRSSNNFAPKASVNRAEAAQVIYNFIKNQ